MFCNVVLTIVQQLFSAVKCIDAEYILLDAIFKNLLE